MCRDIGCNNILSKKNLKLTDVFRDYDFHDINNDIGNLLKKIKHKYDRAEKFIEDNKDMIDKSYYNIGYYNGLTRGYDEVLELMIKTFGGDYNDIIYKEICK